MKSRTFRVFAVLSLFSLFTISPIYSQYVGRFAVKIPFEFVAGNQIMPAGEYSVRPFSSDAPAMLLIQSTEGGSRAAVATKFVQASEINSETKLIFRRYGDKHFLFQIWTPGSDRGRETYKSRAEFESAQSMTNREIVVLANLSGSSLKK